MTGTPVQEKRRHFQTFDALRFFAFFKVFLLHLPITAFPWFNYLRAGGGIGVQFFFVLSGFLITYIILEEKDRTGQFNLKHFFARRILRIWPLYYLMILVAFLTPVITEQLLHVTTSSEGYTPAWWMSLLFLENYKIMATGTHPNVSPLGVMWSLCIEEHFYIIWGLLLFFISVRRLPVVIICSVLIGYVGRYFYAGSGIPALDIFTNIDLFAFGAVPAYLLVTRRFATENRLLRIPVYVKILFTVLLLIVVQLCAQYTDDDEAFVTL
ncbi:MAG TPA: acyltransferase, partial [Flavipsychrobacter sp.]